MKIISKLLLIILLITNIIKVNSQNKNPLDEKYTQPSNSLFGSKTLDKEKTNVGFDDAYFIPQNKIFFGLSEVSRGQFNFYYERKINNYFSAAAGSGLIFFKDYIEELFVHSMNNSIGDNELYFRDLFKNSKLNFGYTLSLNVKILTNPNNTSSYFKFDFRHENKKYTLSNPNIDNFYEDFYYFQSNELEWKQTNNVLFLLRGITIASSNKKYRFMHDVSFGVGIKFLKYDKYLNTGQIENDYKIASKVNGETINLKQPLFTLRYHLGIGWEK